MQGLWARAAQVRSTCRCPFCVPPNGLVSRQSRPVLAKHRITRGDFFLFFSSTIAFEATVLDTVRKDNKLKEWERIIAEERKKVATVEADHSRRVDELVKNAEQRSKRNTVQPTELPQQRRPQVFYRNEHLPHLFSQRVSPNLYLDWTWKGVFTWAAKCDKLRKSAGFQDWKGVPLSFLLRMSPEDSDRLFNEKILLNRFYGGPDCAGLIATKTWGISTKKLRMLEWSVLKMTLRLLSEHRTSNHFPVQTTHQLQNEQALALESESMVNSVTCDLKIQEAEEMVKKADEYRHDSSFWNTIPRPQLPSYEWKGENHDREIGNLNNNIYQILRRFKTREDLGSALTQIAQDLLTTTTPPNIHVYNLILVRLCQLREDKLVWILLDSIEEAKLRPNEITHATLLRFFAMTDDLKSFSSYTKRMKGLSGGLALVDEHEIDPLTRIQFHVFEKQRRKIAVVARMNEEVYSALIVGVLRFWGVKDAMYWFRAMINDGWRPTHEIMVNILRSCCLEKTWEGGVAVWEAFHAEQLKITPVAYTWMLRLCRSCKKERAFDIVLSDAVQQGALTSRILKLPAKIRRGDVDELLKAADNAHVPPGLVSKLPKQHQQNVQDLVNAQGAHFIANAIAETGNRHSMPHRIFSLAKYASWLTTITKKSEKYQTKLDIKTSQIQALTEEIIDQVPSCNKSIKKYTMTLQLRSATTPQGPSGLQTAYQDFKQMANTEREQSNKGELPWWDIYALKASKFGQERHPWQDLQPPPKAKTSGDQASRIDVPDDWWSPDNIAPARLESSA